MTGRFIRTDVRHCFSTWVENEGLHAMLGEKFIFLLEMSSVMRKGLFGFNEMDV